MLKKSPKSSKPQQRNAFIEVARAAGCDESEAVFEGKLRKIAAAKPKVAPRKKGTK